MADNIISIYEKRCREYADDRTKLHEYMMHALPFVHEYYAISGESAVKDETFPLVFKINT